MPTAASSSNSDARENNNKRYEVWIRSGAGKGNIVGMVLETLSSVSTKNLALARIQQVIRSYISTALLLGLNGNMRGQIWSPDPKSDENTNLLHSGLGMDKLANNVEMCVHK